MSCEKIQKRALDGAQQLPAGSKEHLELAQAAAELALACEGRPRTQTKAIMDEICGIVPIPDEFKKHPEKQAALVKNGILREVIV